MNLTDRVSCFLTGSHGGPGVRVRPDQTGNRIINVTSGSFVIDNLLQPRRSHVRSRDVSLTVEPEVSAGVQFDHGESRSCGREESVRTEEPEFSPKTQI